MSSEVVSASKSPEMADDGALCNMVIGEGITGVKQSNPSDLSTPVSSYSTSTSETASECDLRGRPQRAKKHPKAKIRSTEKCMNTCRRVKQVGRSDVYCDGYCDNETAITDEFAQAFNLC
jgi:hypothetical protein